MLCNKKMLGQDSPEFNFWFEGHKSQCEKDFSGSSLAMGVEAALRLWKRSEKAGFRYTTLFSDDNSKAFN